MDNEVQYDFAATKVQYSQQYINTYYYDNQTCKKVTGIIMHACYYISVRLILTYASASACLTCMTTYVPNSISFHVDVPLFHFFLFFGMQQSENRQSESQDNSILPIVMLNTNGLEYCNNDMIQGDIQMISALLLPQKFFRNAFTQTLSAGIYAGAYCSYF
ncbi:unnamed protein product (macronuclear) [Paramecium tetraurelia]|uniref:Transmembrane protein n=1 Tax=Paramecium tetraurelia TaxID=5888 RepID=A0CMS6_PARTE|nr:uncharacterized protein GSPATT00038710001 [Paramecium tetraurelia]CAK72093.1 unnamed protein product [Paramecium tetraurelia]|eukprot:XP_001439490.1 hypothetical protein (macronuclear) [Paramecium tetraurelia strain d4-2]